MIPAATVDGAIAVTLHSRDGIIDRVSVDNQRPTAVRLLQGRGAAEAVALLPTFYALCRTAQLQAGLAAVEQAAGLTPSANQARARRLLLLAETVLEHGMRALIDWPLLLGEPLDAEGARALRGLLPDLPKRLYPHGDLPGGGLLSGAGPDLSDLPRLVERHVFGLPAAAALADLDAWAAQGLTAAARLIRLVRQRGLEAVGCSGVGPMPELPRGLLSARLADDHDGSFVLRPDFEGRLFETGPFARHTGHPLVAPLAAQYGNGLLPRLVARLVELDLALAEMRGLAAQIVPEQPAAVLPEVSGVGLGAVEAVRGLLIHRAELRAGKVTRWQILAPTEWNFHPEGPLAKGLLGSPANEADERARLTVAALDPCVACRVVVV